MLIYWLLYVVPGVLGLVEQNHEARKTRFTAVWFLTAVALTIIIGFRWKTGGDWGNYYADVMKVALDRSFSLATHRDVGYGLLSYLATRIADPGMIVMTGVAGLLMAVALVRFSLKQPRPWLAMSVSVPYIIMVLGMGYMRQGMAVSLLMLGFISLGNGNVLRYTAYAVLAATLHSTSVIFVPLGAMITSRNRVLTWTLGGIISAVAIQQLLASRVDAFMTNYVGTEMDSSGAAVRVMMTAIPGAIFLVFRKRFILNQIERRLWTTLALASMALLVGLVVSPSSTVVDRLGLFILPLQVFVCSRIPDALGTNPQARRLLAVGVLLLYAAAHFVWLFYASHAYMWLPYRSWFFEDGLCYECQDLYQT